MKMKNLFSGILMAATLVLGIGAAVSFDGKANNVDVAEADGTINTSNKTLISLKNTDWTDANIKTAVYFWSGSVHGWSANYVESYPIYDSGNKIRIIDVPSGSWTNYKCVRVNPTGSPSTPSDDCWNYNWGETSNFTFGSNNTLEPVINGGYNYNTAWKFEAGLSIYLDLNSNDWTADDRIIGAYLWGATSGAAATKVQCVNVKGWDNGNVNLYEFVVPGTGYWSNILFYRSTSLEGSWDNQTADLGGNQNNNVYKLTSYTGGSFAWNFNDEGREQALGTHIFDTLHAQCVYYNTNTAASFTNPWKECKDQFDSTNSVVQNAFKNITASESSSDKLANAASAYDYCIRKYGLTNYASRNVTYSGGGRIVFPLGNNDSNGNAIMVVVASLTLTATIGGYFLLKKKRI